MLTLRKKLNRIEIATKNSAPFLSRDLFYAFLIALLLHFLPLAFFTLKKYYFAYSDPIIHSITIAPTLHQLQISTDVPYFPAPPLPTHAPIALPPLAAPLTSYAFSANLESRLTTPAPPPQTPFTKLHLKIDDRTGKVLFYDPPVSKPLHNWLLSLSFTPLPRSFITNGTLEIDSRGLHD